MGLGVSAGALVGRYRLIGELGQGGTSTVSLASATGPAGFNKLVVLKTMKPQFSSEPGFAEMFMSEARLAARLNHPNIVQTNEVFEHDGLPVIVMEYLEGKSLADISVARTPSAPLQLRHDLFVISEALSGLHYSHELTDYEGNPVELVHRDMTPHNVFVTYEGQVKILDFGIAKLSNTTLETETGVVKGKLRYIPPEQIVGEHVDRRADIYSVGVMLWEAAVGEKMWRGVSDAVVMNRVVNEEIPSPSQKGAVVAPALEALIMKALSPDPADRHQTAFELQVELDSFRKQLGELPTSRTLGPELQRMFDVERTETKRVIEKRLSLPPPADGAPAQPSATGRLHPAWLFAVAVLAAAIVWWVSGAAPAARDAAREARPAPVEVTSRAVRFTAFPRNARIEIDGVPTSSNPFSTTMPADDRDHRVQIAAQGFEPIAETFRLDRGDVDVVFRLQAEVSPEPSSERARDVRPDPSIEPAPANKSTSRVEGSASTSTSSTEVEATPGECDPPFVVDGRGIKRFKEHCMP